MINYMPVPRDRTFNFRLLEDVGDFTMELEKFRQSVIHKAVKLSKDIDTITIGPKCYTNGVKSEGETDTPETEHCKKEKSPEKQKQSNLNSFSFSAAVDDVNTRTLKINNNLLEQQRWKDVLDAVKPRLQKMTAVTSLSQKEMELRRECIEKEVQAKALLGEHQIWHQVQQEELQATKRKEQRIYEHRQHIMRVQERNLLIKKAEQEEAAAKEEQKRKLKEKQEYLNKMYLHQVGFRDTYQQMVDTFKLCKDRQAANSAFTALLPKVKSLSDALSQLIKQCVVGEVNSLDIQTATAITQQINSILNQYKSDVAKINEQFDKTNAELEAKEKLQQQQQQQQQLQQQQLQQQQFQQRQYQQQQQHLQQQQKQMLPQQEQQTQEVPLDDSAGINEFGDKESISIHRTLMQHLQELKATYSVLVNDEKLKKFKFDCQKAVNVPVNAISPVSAAHMEDKLRKLSSLLSGQTVEAGSSHISASSHPQGIAFCKDLLARKFVFQGELTVSSKPEAAFPIAAVIVALWVNFPDFGQLLLGHFYKKCPYLAPIYPPQIEGQSNEDYYKSLGYHYSENAEVEKQDKFLKRMSGIMRLYAAIMITPVRQGQRKLHPHGVAKAWRWIACLLNMDPRPDISATLLFDFLEVAGNAMYSHYGKQFQKLLHVICKEYFPKIEKLSSSGGPVARLESFLQKILKENRIAPPVGQLPQNFW